MTDNQATYYLCGNEYTQAELLRFANAKLDDNNTEEWEKDIFAFILQWFDPNGFVRVNTSGSTGKPKTISLEKRYMEESARATLKFFNLQQGNKALLCLPASYIAGKMMIVRALKGGLDLHCIKPRLNPDFSETGSFDFVALIPGMLSDIINKGKTKQLSRFNKILLGGSSISNNTEQKLSAVDAEIFHGYGMTETITHIALRQISGADASEWSSPLPGVQLSLFQEGTLIINYPKIGVSGLITNDIAEINQKGDFRVSGRKDNVIISGGLKIHPEEIEKKIKGIINNEFIVYGIADEWLGQKLVLFIEGEPNKSVDQLKSELMSILDKNHMPKEVYFVPEFARTESGKILRKDYMN